MRILFLYAFLFLAASLLAQTETKDTLTKTTHVRIKNGLISFKQNLPPEDAQVYITVKLQNESDGYYQIKYRVGKNSIYEIEKKKVDSPAASTLKVIGGLLSIVVVVFTIIKR